MRCCRQFRAALVILSMPITTSVTASCSLEDAKVGSKVSELLLVTDEGSFRNVSPISRIGEKPMYGMRKKGGRNDGLETPERATTFLHYNRAGSRNE